VTGIDREILEQVIAASSEPLLVVRVDQPDWPVVLANPSFEAINGDETTGKPFADVIEALGGRELAAEVSQSVRAGEATSFALDTGSSEYLLALKPLVVPGDDAPRFYAAFWQSSSTTVSSADSEMHHALLKAKRRIRDLSRDDVVTGLLNGRAFREVFEHDWAVAAREKTRLALVTFTLDEFDAYVEVFGQHAADSCLRRVGQTIRRCLRRASDVVARPGGALFVALSHASEEAGVRTFAGEISRAVRDLGMHHPHATESRFVTVTSGVAVAEPGNESQSAGEFLDELLNRVSQ
jgi:diguanylate cyclase (GGDEF)-like protein